MTAIEVLCPENKLTYRGHKEYMERRSRYLESNVNLVELDLLRCGRRLPVIEPLPGADYYAIVSRPRRGPTVEVYHWELYERLPAFAVPLSEDDPDVVLDLQAAFERSYERGGYDYALNYDAPLDPPLRGTA